MTELNIFCETKSCWYFDYSNKMYTHLHVPGLFIILVDEDCDLPGLDTKIYAFPILTSVVES